MHILLNRKILLSLGKRIILESIYNLPHFIKYCLTFSVPFSKKEKKINLNFYFHTSLWCLKRFYEGLKGFHKTFKAFIKPFEAPFVRTFQWTSSECLINVTVIKNELSLIQRLKMIKLLVILFTIT